MRKNIIIAIIILTFTGCNTALSPEEIVSKTLNPFKEYKITDTTLAEKVEKGILEREAESKELDLISSSAHLISYTKIGTYGKGEVRILGRFTEEGLKKINKKPSYKNANEIVSYTAIFEYSEKTGGFSWISDYPYN